MIPNSIVKGEYTIDRIKKLMEDSRNKRIAAILLAVLILAASLTVIYVKRKPITVVIDGKPTQIVTYKSNVGEALKKCNIPVGPKDKLQPALDTELKKNDTITIKRAVNVKVAVDGKELGILSAEESIAAMLKAEGITLKGEDKVKPESKAKLAEGLKIEVIRVEKKTLTEKSTIAFKTLVKTDRSLSNTTRRVLQEGKNGEKHITALVTYENGKEVARKIVKESIAKQPVDTIIVQGTYPKMPISRGGGILPYRKVLKSRTTAYYAIYGVGHTYTASGRKAVRNPDGYSTVAVDPRVIPYGTKLFIEGYGFAVAADTGTAIKGTTIDVFFNTYREACNWAVKYVKVYIL